ncbi:MAG: hypothetical protein DRO89_01560 [Candidatus Altiarchaeales archaeon]|nr:MAG: hypothetical protein DRO89_01560 [Candidatus Altiarchaeales archaeon]
MDECWEKNSQPEYHEINFYEAPLITPIFGPDGTGLPKSMKQTGKETNCLQADGNSRQRESIP